MDRWIHLSRVKRMMEESPDQIQPEDTYSCELIEDLKILFQRDKKASP
jgi:hypothetical protein